MKMKMNKQLRINFPDYTVEQQESDVLKYMRLKEKYRPHLYLLKIHGMWSHITLTPNTYRPTPHFYEGKNLFQVYNEIKKDYPEYKVKYIINQGLENYLKDEYKKKQVVDARIKQIKINWKE